MTSQSEGNQRRGCLPVVIGCVVLFFVLLVAGFMTASMTPPAFVPPQLDDPEAQERAETFEQNFSAELTRVRDDEEPWGVRVRQADLNAWLWFRLPAWVAHVHGEEAMGSRPLVQVNIEETGLQLTTESVVFGLTTDVQDGRALIRPGAGSSIGRLPLPGSWASAWAMSSLDLEQLAEGVLGESSDLDGALVPSAIELPDGRVVELLECQPSEGEVVLVFRTRRP